MSLPGLGELRDAIDDIDRRILDLLRERVALVLRVGDLKRQHGSEVYDPERERRMLDALAKAAEPPLGADTARRVFERIISESREQEQRHVSDIPPTTD